MADIFDLFRQISKKEDTPKAPITHMIVGLGNPGEKYKMTRHNAGFLTIDHLAEQYGVRIDRAKFHALCGEGTVMGKGILFLKPQTLMNASGLAVQEAAAFYKIAPENILVISDDIAQDVGRMRLRRKGSAGGQKGLNDIIVCLGTDAFPRLRMGVGAKPHPDFNLADWVLSEFRPDERPRLYGAIAACKPGIEKLLSGDFDTAVQLCNSYHPEHE
ncbi:MAG: aminoacyl-tRNA hydrolase [Ruminococcaceae bacterium]|nr:aminoacyl-tRNA hydrolase [Oscillospiraceae bacterium]